MTSNTEIYDMLRRPPKWALREIKEGNLKGKTDINPQWRLEAMTTAFGPVGIGWYHDKPTFTIYDCANSEKMVLAEVNVYTLDKESREWSKPIYGAGGSMLVNNFTKAGMKNNDEAFKMALTDAFSYAFKQLGVGADVYAGKWDGSKYRDDPTQPQKAAQAPVKATAPAEPKKQPVKATKEQIDKLAALAKAFNQAELDDFKNKYNGDPAGMIDAMTMARNAKFEAGTLHQEQNPEDFDDDSKELYDERS